ncbi:MAG: tetratricopeptide repeat protein [Bacteriovoracaceae bacterium]|nr:tetratricopeptide repeat protein [Bacteriovoracaceae bacterium]
MINQREKELVEKAKEHFNSGRFKNAKKLFDEVIEINYNNIEAFFYLGNIFHQNGEIGKAIKAFNKVLSLDPAHTDAAISLSVLYNDIGKYEEAKKVFEVASSRVKNNTAVSKGINDTHVNKKFALKHFEIGDLYMGYNRFDEALFEYNKCIRLNPLKFEARIKIAKVYAKKGLMSKAFDELKSLKNEDPSYLPARISLGVLYYGVGSILEAQTEWKNVLAKDPRNQEAHMYLNLSGTASETRLDY